MRSAALLSLLIEKYNLPRVRRGNNCGKNQPSAALRRVECLESSPPHQILRRLRCLAASQGRNPLAAAAMQLPHRRMMWSFRLHHFRCACTFKDNARPMRCNNCRHEYREWATIGRTLITSAGLFSVDFCLTVQNAFGLVACAAEVIDAAAATPEGVGSGGDFISGALSPTDHRRRHSVAAATLPHCRRHTVRLVW